MVNQDNVIAMGKNIDFMQNQSLDTVMFIEDGVGGDGDWTVGTDVVTTPDEGKYSTSGSAIGHYKQSDLKDANGDGSRYDDAYDVDNCVRETGATVVLYTESAGWVDAGSVEGTLAVGLDNLSAENQLTMTTQHIDANKSSVQTSKRSIQIS